MSVPYTRAPHQGGMVLSGADSPHAALLIDFDNVTMGMRSDLSKELKTLLDSDVIKGKVSVQRAYADWRRYPQYIVPLSEASVDLIFAPAYGSSKKNATDIRMAIDALELIFIRPEIGTFILLTGDSDFSSLVLKLKEYGKYVIGVGIQESSSDILVQNCDEYYSYTSLTGLTKTTELSRDSRDPWVLVKDAVARMVQRGDVMRSDRLKQVMQEIDPTFDEGGIGFSKFSKFIAEASSRGLVTLKKMENGQYEIVGGGRGGRSSSRDDSRGRRERGRGGRGRGRSSRSSDRGSDDGQDTSSDTASGASDGDTGSAGDPLNDAYDLLRAALTALREQGRDAVRDSDVKRKILERDRSFDETELGFPKFSRFLAQAEEHGVVTLERTDAGNLDVSLADGDGSGRAPSQPTRDSEAAPSRSAPQASAPDPAPAPEAPAAQAPPPPPEPPAPEPTVVEVEPPRRSWFGLKLGPRRGSTRRRADEDAPTLLAGQTATPPKQSQEAPPATSAPPVQSTEVASTVRDDTGSARDDGRRERSSRSDASESGGSWSDSRPDEGDNHRGDHGDDHGSGGAVSIEELALPSENGAIVRYLAHRYKGVGEKTAETLVEALGSDIFRTMQEDPDAIARIVPPKRAEQVLAAWQADYERRASSMGGTESGDSSGRRGGRGRSRGRGRS